MKEQSILMDFLGDSPKLRVWDYLLVWGSLGVSKTDIANNAKVGRATLYRIWDDLIKTKTIVYSRTVGRSRLYTLNKKDPKIKKLLELDKILVMEELKRKKVEFEKAGILKKPKQKRKKVTAKAKI